MKHQLKLGDSVSVLDEAIEGIIIKIDQNMVTLETKEGLPLAYPLFQLVKIGEGLRVSNFEVAKVKKEKESTVKNKAQTKRPKERNAPKMEVDLHIGQLLKSTKGMSNYDILNLQVDTAKRQLDFAIRKRIQKIVFIHGVGDGVLKEELKYLFKRYDNLKFYDAEYKKYGLGATEVYIFQNPSLK